MTERPNIGDTPYPQHIAFIMDGNGRWAKSQGKQRTDGHRAGVEVVRTVLDLSDQWDIPWITLYAFSTENWQRPNDEINTLFALLAEYVVKELPEFHKRQSRLHVLGDTSPLPEPTQQALQMGVEQTEAYDRRHVQIAVNYGSRDEIIRGFERWLTSDPASRPPLDAQNFGQYLDSHLAPDPDLMVRTSGEQRVSNFLLWQLAYSEFIFVHEPWPDFDEQTYRSVLQTYGQRRRRFGQTDEQI